MVYASFDLSGLERAELGHRIYERTMEKRQMRLTQQRHQEGRLEPDCWLEIAIDMH